jgi:hypothetical protein
MSVRYAVACLDLDVTFKPAPRGSTVHRPFVTEQGGKAMFPYMVDPNTGDSMYEVSCLGRGGWIRVDWGASIGEVGRRGLFV